MATVNLGDRVKDTISGFSGIATARAIFLNGCIRIEITAEKLKENGEVNQLWLDEVQLTITKKAAKAPAQTKPRHGPRSDAMRHVVK